MPCFPHNNAPPTHPPIQLPCPQKLETALKEEILRAQKWLEVILEQEKQMKMFKNCLTVQEVFRQQESVHQGLIYRRIPLDDCSAPREEVTSGRHVHTHTFLSDFMITKNLRQAQIKDNLLQPLKRASLLQTVRDTA